MPVPFLDTDIFLRHLLNDDPVKSPACFALFQAVERGQLTAWTSELVVAELVWVLSSKHIYNLPRERIRALLLPLILLPRLRVPHKRMYTRIFDLYTSVPIHFIDAYHVARLEQRGEAELYSYDRDFDRVPTVIRREPQVTT